MATTYITRTTGTSTNVDKCTFSGWIKRSYGTSTADEVFMGEYTDASNRGKLIFAGDMLHYFQKTGGSTTADVKTTRVFRDQGAWYHIVVAFDSTQVTDTDRIKFYINGVQETVFTNTSYPSSGQNIRINESSAPIFIGQAGASASYFSGEMSHVQFVDGLQLAPTEFGEVDSTSGIWKIKTTAYATPGTNGFFLKMEDRTNLDLDSSSNAHTFTTTGTLTATYDNPSNNFATLNPLAKDVAATYAISNGNTTVQSSSGWWTMPLTLGVGGGKWFFEAKMNSLTNYAQVGWATNDFISNGGVTNYLGHTGGNNSACGYGQDGTIYYSTSTSNTDSTAYANTFTTGDVMGCALDLDNGFAYWSIDGVWQNSGDPTSGATGTGAFTIDNPTAKGYLWLPAVSLYTATWNMNTGNGYFGTTLISSPEADDGGIGAFAYDVPAGYRAVCTKNIKAYGG